MTRTTLTLALALAAAAGPATTRTDIHLPVAGAKKWSEYLAESDGDAEKAGQAARTDVVAREQQNSAARRFHRVYSALAGELGLSEDPQDEDAAKEAATAAVKKLKADAGSSDEGKKQLEAYSAALKKLGIDPDKLDEGVAAAEAKFARAGTADKLERESAFSKAAESLGFDAGKLTHVLRDEEGVPELRKVKKEGSDEEVDVYGIAGKDDKGKETFTALAEHPSIKGYEGGLKKADAAPVTESRPSTPKFVEQRQGTTANPSTTVDARQSAVAPGAGRI